jgi:hypothetical protein
MQVVSHKQRAAKCAEEVTCHKNTGRGDSIAAYPNGFNQDVLNSMLSALPPMNVLIEEVRRRTHCNNLRLPFEMADCAGRAFRFPPTIGATAPAPLLFVGAQEGMKNESRS